MNGHDDIVSMVKFSADGNNLITASWDKTIKIWDKQTGKKICGFEGHNEKVTSIHYSPDEKYIVSGSYDKTVKIWDIE